jgi:hypothetical protein
VRLQDSRFGERLSAIAVIHQQQIYNHGQVFGTDDCSN